MTQFLAFSPFQSERHLLCGYVNTTNQIQIVRIANIPSWYFERVVFPRQQLLFAAPPSAQLEIHTGEIPSSMLTDRITCDRLQVQDNLSASLLYQ